MAPAEDSNPSNKAKFCCRIAAISVCILTILGAAVFFLIGRWLVAEDPLQHSDAIVVLSGKMPQRALEAARLYKLGYAPQVWLTRSREPASMLQGMRIAYIGEDFYNAQILMHEGVPSNAVRVLEPTIRNTADEVQTIAAELLRMKETSVIIVTSKAHTRRVRVLWHDLHVGEVRGIVRAASMDNFAVENWWRTTDDALDVVRETLGLVNAWLGLPLKPAPN